MEIKKIKINGDIEVALTEIPDLLVFSDSAFFGLSHLDSNVS